jgi:hypothetical protein
MAANCHPPAPVLRDRNPDNLPNLSPCRQADWVRFIIYHAAPPTKITKIRHICHLDSTTGRSAIRPVPPRKAQNSDPSSLNCPKNPQRFTKPGSTSRPTVTWPRPANPNHKISRQLSPATRLDCSIGFVFAICSPNCPVPKPEIQKNARSITSPHHQPHTQVVQKSHFASPHPYPPIPSEPANQQTLRSVTPQPGSIGFFRKYRGWPGQQEWQATSNFWTYPCSSV